jgi:hypothetical protein
MTLPHNLICEAGIHYLRVKLKAEGAHRDTSYPLRRYIRCYNGNSQRWVIQSTVNGPSSIVLLLHCASIFEGGKNVTCYNQMIVAIVDLLTSFFFLALYNLLYSFLRSFSSAVSSRLLCLL